MLRCIFTPILGEAEGELCRVCRSKKRVFPEDLALTVTFIAYTEAAFGDTFSNLLPRSAYAVADTLSCVA
jgi:hypothetical protein